MSAINALKASPPSPAGNESGGFFTWLNFADFLAFTCILRANSLPACWLLFRSAADLPPLPSRLTSSWPELYKFLRDITNLSFQSDTDHFQCYFSDNFQCVAHHFQWDADHFQWDVDLFSVMQNIFSVMQIIFNAMQIIFSAMHIIFSVKLIISVCCRSF